MRNETKPRLTEFALEMLRQKILSGEMAPGSRISDAAVADDLRISRAPIREALRRLEAEHLVVDRRRRGTFVRQYKAADVVELNEVRVVLETAATELAIEAQASPAVLEPILARMIEAGHNKDSLAVADADLAFHEALVSLSGNRWLERVYRSISVQTRLVLNVYTSVVSRDLEKVAERHVPLMNAVRAGNGRGVAQMVRRHIERGLPDLVRRITSDGQDLFRP